MLIDCHAHTSGISKCCQIDAEQVIQTAKSVGLDGMVITNHYQKSYIENGNADAFAEKYISEYHYARKIGDNYNIKIFYGIEVSIEQFPNVHILVYGINDDFIRKNPSMFDYSQKELYERVHQNGGIVIQAHPFRNGTTVLDVNYLDGIEINCHPLYKKSHSEEILQIARKNHLAVICGGDFHADTYRPKCGVFTPNSINNSQELSAYISSADRLELCVQEPEEKEIKKLVYLK